MVSVRGHPGEKRLIVSNTTTHVVTGSLRPVVLSLLDAATLLI